MILTCVTAVFNAIKSGNRENLIRCVRSVAALKTEHEHLIYDGASTDGTVELLRELEAKTPGLKVTSEKDGGIYSALNKGVRDAKGAWFHVLGCDDRVIPEALDQLLAKIENAAEQMVIAPVLRDEGKGAPLIHAPDCRRLLWSTPYCHQGVLMRTTLVRQFGGFDERFKVCADYDMMLKCHFRAVPMSFLPEAFAIYGAGGFSDHPERLHRDYAFVMKEHFHLTDPQIARVRKHMLFPIFKAWSLRHHIDAGVREAARHALTNWRGYMVHCIHHPIEFLKGC